MSDDTSDTPSLADLLPANVRRWVYAVLAVLIPALTAFVAIFDVSDLTADVVAWLIVVVASTGFVVARSNTPAG